MQPYCPVTRGRYLVIFEVKELIGRNVLGQDKTAFGLQHHREYYTMKDDIILPDEMHHLRFIILPVFLPVGCKLPCCRYIAYGGVEPYIKHFAFSTLNRKGNTPVEVAAHRPGLKSLVEPRFALSIDIWLPFLMLLQYPFPEPLLVPVEGQIPVKRLAQDRLAAADGRAGINEIIGREACAALFTLVAVCIFIFAVGTGAGDIPVGKKTAGFLIIILFRRFLDKLALFVKGQKKIRCCFIVEPARGA